MKIGKYDFDEECPEYCPGKNEPFYQGSLCTRCPIFNCTGDFKLIEPEDYREDWAEEFYNWMYIDFFNDYPRLAL